MKKSKFVLMSLILIVFVGFSLIFVPVEVKAASEDELDIEDYWVESGFPLTAMEYEFSDGKGITFFVQNVIDYFFGEPAYVVLVSPIQDYYFNDGELYANEGYGIRFLIISDDTVSMLNYYLDTYGSFVDIPEWDRMIISWDVDQQRFVGPNYLFYWIDTSYNEGYDEGQNVGYSEGYDEGYDIGFEIAQPKMDILLITFIMFIVSVFVYFKFRLRWVLIATTLLWFVPIFLVENLFIKIFSAIMIVATIVITFFNEREEDYE